MTTEVKVPMLPESVADATVAKWYVKPGDKIERDQHLVDLETDKVMLEVQAIEDGVLDKILKEEGAVVTAEEVIALISPGAETAKAGATQKADKQTEKKEENEKPKKATGTKATQPTENREMDKAGEQSLAVGGQRQQSAEDPGPAVRRLLAEHDIDIAAVKGRNKDGRVTKQDVVDYMEQMLKERENKKTPATTTAAVAKTEIEEGRPEQRVPMSRLRARIAERLVQAQHTTASLTTFNEVNMQPVMDIRSRYKDVFEKKYKVRLGFMSFFVKAAVEALKNFPAVNASIDGQDVIYHGYFDIGIAVSTPRGLVVPIIRNADQLSMAEIEEKINEFANKARDNKLTIEDMTGGTFTITNGGVFGSMLSTPIINPPQSAILGMHNIIKRAVVEEDNMVIRPIMYLALSYDHRIIDGRESVSFLVTIKNLLEDPARLILEI